MSYPSGGASAAGSSNPSAPPTTKPLWAVIGVLSMCILAMGASLVSIHKRSTEPTAAGANLLRFASSNNALGLRAPSSGANSMITETADGRPIDKPPSTQENNAQPAAKNGAKPVVGKNQNQNQNQNQSRNAPASSPTAQAQTPTAHGAAPVAAGAQPPAAPQVLAPAPAPAPAPAKPICTSCGTIEAVTPVTRPGKGSGVGMVAGGVLGGVLGNQVGGGNGRTAATVLGAVGGGWAGNAVEKNIKKDTVYQVRVRMQDGTVRTLEQASAPPVGSKVAVEGSTLRTSDGAVYAPAPEQRARAPQPQPPKDIYNTGG